MEHVEVLWAMLRKCVNERLARKSADREAAALAAAIEALKSAPQPPAEAQPDWEAAPPGTTHYHPHQDLYYKRVSASEWYVWNRMEPREPLRWLLSPGTSDSAEWVVRPTDAMPPPSASVGVEDESVRVGNFPTMNQDGYPGLGEWWVQLWRGDEVIARVYGDGPDEVRSQAQDIADALNQQPAAVDAPQRPGNPTPASLAAAFHAFGEAITEDGPVVRAMQRIMFDARQRDALEAQQGGGTDE